MRIFLFSLLFTLGIPCISWSAINFVRAMFNSNAAFEITIAWNQKSGENPRLFYDTQNSGKDFVQQAGISKKVHAKNMHNHFVRLTNLTPATTYYFYVQDSEGKSRIYHFRTVSNQSDQAISFVAGGDSRDQREVRQKGNRMVAKLRPDAVLFNGDFTGLDLPRQWVNWFEDWELSITDDGKVSPLIVTRGNHEVSNQVMVDLFDVPHPKVYYSTTLGGDLVHIVSLNSEILKVMGQKRFLKTALRDHQHFYWQIPQYHRPIRAHVAKKKEMETEYQHFVPLFESYSNVRLCLENDSHTCKTTWPILSSKSADSDEGFVRNDQKGIVYVGEGCWGAPLRAADDKKSWTRDAEAVNQINWIFVTREKIEVRTVLYDYVDELEAVKEDHRFEMPTGIRLWGPNNGTLIEIFPIK
ncbi:MAG: metallophosphoesterase family protein [Bacteroidetes bacterium]|nr:MAG: metallophosphoesterase family protein [Bacteroidota bacterium]